jgi:hypothetical protein
MSASMKKMYSSVTLACSSLASGAQRALGRSVLMQRNAARRPASPERASATRAATRIAARRRTRRAIRSAGSAGSGGSAGAHQCFTLPGLLYGT